MMLQTILFMCMILAILSFFSKKKESFTSCSFLNAYDKEHVSIYDTLVYDGLKNDQEISFLNPVLNADSIVLDVGSGTGHHVHALQERGIHSVGVDASQAMVMAAKKSYNYDFFHGNALTTTLFQPESFTHILCMYYTIYYMKNKQSFFQNVHTWLMSGGYMILHLSKKWDYGPTSTFKGPFVYSSSHVHDRHHELITKNGKRSRIEHKIYMESISSIIGIAKQTGFVVHSIYKYPLPYTEQYLYIFTKM